VRGKARRRNRAECGVRREACTNGASVRPEPRACESVARACPELRACESVARACPEPRACKSVARGTAWLFVLRPGSARTVFGCSYFDKLNTNGSSVRPEPRACESVEGERHGCSCFDPAQHERCLAVHISTSSIRTVSPFALSLARASRSQGPALSLARASRSKGERPQPCCSYFDKLNTNGSSVRPEPRACESVEGERRRRGCSYFDKLYTNGLPTTVDCSRFDQAQHERMWVVHASTSSARTVTPFALSLARASRSQGPALSFAHASQSQGPALSLAHARQSKGETPRAGRSYFDKLNTNGSSVRPEPRACESVEGERRRRGCSYFDKLNTNGLPTTVGLFALRPSSPRTALPFALSLARASRSKGGTPRAGRSYFDKLTTNGWVIRTATGLPPGSHRREAGIRSAFRRVQHPSR
jgi:hypothetical protein